MRKKDDKLMQRIVECFDTLYKKEGRNDIHRLLDSKEPNFEEGKNLIIKCAALKFQECTDDPRRVYSSKVLTEIRHFAETQVYEYNLILDSLLSFRDKLIAQGRYTDGVDDTILAVSK